ncbi:hypothetical protein LCGC14_1312260 [marine sediment metagenome]|uniref:Uncharacterized protein n=1 Tax=marine sediment metagenome TaxID=412755 RepID=A0A0F9KMG7_9ZZZZ
MAKTQLKHLGSSVLVDDRDEKLVPALGNGSAIPGEFCAIDPSNGRVVGSDVGALEQFVGILKESKITGTETAIVTDVPCMLVVPKSGHAYRGRIDDVGATLKHGHSIKFGANPGYAVKTTNLLDPGVIGRLSLEALNGDTVVEFTYR